MGPLSPLTGRSSRADEFCCEKEEELLFSQSSLVTLLCLVLLDQCFNKLGGWLRAVDLIIGESHSDECYICKAEN